MFMIPCISAPSAGYKHRSVRRDRTPQLRFTPTSRLYVEERNWPRFCAEAGEEAVVTAQGGRFMLWTVRAAGSSDRASMLRLILGLGANQLLQKGVGTRFYPQYRGRFELTVAEEISFWPLTK